MPRRNRRDRRFEPREYDNNERSYDYPSQKQKPLRRRKGKGDKRIYRENE